MVSVVICTYNTERFIVEAIDSVFAQDYPLAKVEIIVVDDGSTDNTAKILKEKYSGKIKYFYRKNGGHSAAINTAIEKMSGKYVCFLDADDFWDKNKLREVVGLFESDNEIDVVYNYLRVINEAKKVIGAYPNKDVSNPDYLSEDHLHEYLVGRIPFAPPTSGISIRVECLLQIGKIPEERAYPDIVLQSVIPFYAKKIRFIKKHLHSYRIHANNTWENKPFSIKTLERDIATYVELREQIKFHSQKTGYRAKKYIARMDLEINQKRILWLRMNGKIFSAVWLALTGSYPVFERHRYALTYLLYRRLTIFASALLSDKAYSKLHATYIDTNLYGRLHLFWLRK
jgi:glycosyltransferase involved in cell wall biosynthesis